MMAGIGFTGDPAYIPMLIKQMENPELARAAGESISLITGLNLVAENLAGEQPEGFEAGPNDDPQDENTEMDLDEDLPWPDANLVSGWWEQHKGNFNVGSRYIDGKPVSPAQCNHVLKHGMQSHRSAAALELALSRADAPWFNTLAPGSWQLKSLAVEA